MGVSVGINILEWFKCGCEVGVNADGGTKLEGTVNLSRFRLRVGRKNVEIIIRYK